MNNTITNGDFYELVQQIPDESIDLILTDPPYGTIQQKWDVKIDIPKMMEEFLRVAKGKTPIVITCQQPFATDVMNAGRKFFREELIWDKVGALGFFNANKKHLRTHENVFVFSKGANNYNPIMTAKKKAVLMGGGQTNFTQRSNQFGGSLLNPSRKVLSSLRMLLLTMPDTRPKNPKNFSSI